MADFTVNAPRARHMRTGKWEYRIWFALIFGAALPFALGSWAWGTLRDGRMPAQGPVARARAEAHLIAPTILRG